MGDIIISFRISTKRVCSVFDGERFTYRKDDAKRYKTLSCEDAINKNNVFFKNKA